MSGVAVCRVSGESNRNDPGSGRRVARADTVIAGTAVRTYIYRYAATAQGQTVKVKTTLHVGTQTDLPRRAVTSGGREDATIDYYDYGAKIDIRLLPCPGG
jgi:hypothetical protein